MRYGLAFLLLFLPMSAHAQKLDDPQRFDRRLATCNGCHGREGIPANPIRPIIFGQTAKYIDARIGDFKRGEEGDQEMTTLLSDLGRMDIVKLNDWYAGKSWPDIDAPPATPEIADRAEQLIARGDCTAGGCHENQFTGGHVRIAGQQPEYLKHALTRLRDKTRPSPIMEGPAAGLTDEEIAVLAIYLAGLKR